jgi:NAD(P)-dependent dehydrogenase (short-subunit alcohol dehydrogenase family)
MSLVVLTNVVEYTGPGALPVLVDDGHTVVCHDRSFSDRSGRVKFAEKNPKARVLAGQNAAAIYEETFATWGIPDAIVLTGFAVPTTARAATTAFAKALAKEVAPFGIQVNVVAPNYLYSEMYYPKARFVDSAEGRDLIARTVPFGRLGQPEEVGALIAFLASGKSPFMTGQVIHFTGGWS